ncbi:hypothetical protein BSCA_1904 [Bifidobacterium scardovii]|uniref:Uncharacterized protein n=2 Tax=Bifidobacterium scardovii TaxID=158787 RepID=A0A087D443_9BIFI|nr:hypothetical protein BSCA_1904 [Bifidobacterium scardovii]
MWQKWLLVILYLLMLIGNVSSIGKKRDPITPQSAVADVIFNLALIAVILSIPEVA